MPARIAVVGHDAREWYAACVLAERGHDVVYAGPVPARGVRWPAAPGVRSDLAEVAAGRDALIGPVRGFGEEGERRVARQLPTLRPGGLLVVGAPGAALLEAAAAHGVRVVDLQAWEPFAVLNAVPTAEGAIAEALAGAERTIWRSRCTVLGFGRVGQALAQRLLALGAEVTVCARDPAGLARAAALGCRAVTLSRLDRALAGADMVFNTVPAPVVDGRALQACPDGVLLIDLASPPGGFDRPAVEQRGLAFRWSLGIPGRVTPRTAGLILADTVEDLVAAPPQRR